MAHVHINPDKLAHDRPPADQSAIYPLHPFRCLFVSMPGGGKRQACLELIGHHPKPFGTITVMHLDSGTSEYEILGENAKMISEDDLPDASTFDRSKRNLLIINEINISDKKTAHKKRFDRLFNYCSTHCSLSIICQVQDAFTLPVSCRRAMNHWALWRSSDSYVMSTLGRRLGINHLADVFGELELGPHDFVWCYLSGNGPRLRKNPTRIITAGD